MIRYNVEIYNFRDALERSFGAYAISVPAMVNELIGIAKDIFSVAEKNVSLEGCHSLKDLAKLGWPYANRPVGSLPAWLERRLASRVRPRYPRSYFIEKYGKRPIPHSPTYLVHKRDYTREGIKEGAQYNRISGALWKSLRYATFISPDTQGSAESWIGHWIKDPSNYRKVDEGPENRLGVDEVTRRVGLQNAEQVIFGGYKSGKGKFLPWVYQSRMIHRNYGKYKPK